MCLVMNEECLSTLLVLKLMEELSCKVARKISYEGKKERKVGRKRVKRNRLRLVSDRTFC